MATTAHLGITLVEQSQAQKEVTVNEALKKIDALSNTGAIDKDLSTPPASPAEGDVYIVANAATDDWASHENDIAYFDGIWKFIAPQEGITIWMNDEDTLYSFDGSSWIQAGDNFTELGVNATPDATNKLSVSSDAVLFNHNGNGTQIKLNKNTATDTASFLFQTGFSGRAEFGCIGNDQFSLKVSSDGSNFFSAFSIDNSNGNTAFQKMVGFGTPESLTISAGIVTISQSYVEIDTESSASTDNLNTINGGNEGDLLIVKSVNSSRSVVLKDGTGNIALPADVTLSSTADRVMLQKDDAGIWRQIATSSN